jgi:hypothetical protein
VAALTEATERWAAGVTWEPEGCGVSGVYDASTCPPDDTPIEIPDGRDTITANPYVVWAGDKCSPWELARDWKGKAQRQLLATESYQIAFELWTGTQAQASNWDNRYLASPLSDVLTDGPESPTHALACLELGIAKAGKGRRGMIHATADVVTEWWARGALRREAGLILTVLDTIIVPDAGYDGSGPNGEPAADGSVWAYGTEIVQVRHSAVRYVPSDEAISARNFDRSVNTVLFRAERDALATWDACIHVAVEVDIGLCGIGGS